MDSHCIHCTLLCRLAVEPQSTLRTICRGRGTIACETSTHNKGNHRPHPVKGQGLRRAMAHGGGWGRNGNPSIRASRSAHGEAHVSPRNVYAYLMISAKSQPCNPRRDLIKSPMPDRVPRTKVDHMPMNCILLNASVICCRSTLLSDPLPCPFFHRLNARH